MTFFSKVLFSPHSQVAIRYINVHEYISGLLDGGVSAVVLPSLPVCMWEGDTDVGGTVTLTCLVTEGVPTPQMSWEKLEPHHIILPISMGGNKYISIIRLNMWRKTWHERKGCREIKAMSTYLCLFFRGVNGFGANCKHVCTGLWCVSLLRDQRSGHKKLLCEPLSVHMWVSTRSLSNQHL